MSIDGLGRTFDVCHGFVPVNMATAANPGARVHMRNYRHLAVVFYKGVGGAAEAPTLTLQEHSAASGGTSQNLAVITEYFVKVEATLDGDETWSRVTQNAAATVTNADWDDANQVLVVFEVPASSLSDGFEWLSVNVADVGTTAQLGALLYIPHGIRYQVRPDLMPQPNA